MDEYRVVFTMPQEEGDVTELYSNLAIDEVLSMMHRHPVIGMVTNGLIEVHIGYAVFDADGYPIFSLPVNDHPYTYANLVGEAGYVWKVQTYQ